MDIEERKKRWSETAIERELQRIEQLGEGINVQKPNNPYWQSLFRLAGISKAGYVARDEALRRIKQASSHLDLPDKIIEYQWQRAYARAKPRHPKGLSEIQLGGKRCD